MLFPVCCLHIAAGYVLLIPVRVRVCRVLLFAAWCVPCCLSLCLFVVRCVLLVDCHLLFGVCCLLRVVVVCCRVSCAVVLLCGCLMFIVCCCVFMLFVFACVLYIGVVVFDVCCLVLV